MKYSAIFVLSAAALAASAAAPDHADGIEPFFGDVFVVSGSGDLIHVDPRSTLPGEPLYNIAGEPVGQTWGQWSAATGTSAVHCAGGRTRAKFALSGLVPGGVYSIFHTTFTPDSQNPLCPVERSIATVESFTADAGGNARLHAEDDGCLLDASVLTYAVIYHLDGTTWGALPNRAASVSQGPDCRSFFGADAFRQFLIIQKSP